MKNTLETIASGVTRKLFEADEKKGSPKTVGVIDTNLGIDHALAISNDFEVYYWLADSGAFPVIQGQISGDGFAGIKKVDDISEVIDKDVVIITDCYFGKLADYLREKGIAVFGPSGEWTRIENERVYGWNRLKEMGVGVPTGKVVKGIDEFLKYIRENEDGKRIFFVKVNKYRGNRETGSVMNETEALTAITQAGYGPYLTDIELLMQDPCPGIEIGFDAFFNGKDYIRPFLYTIEVKGQGTIGVWTERNGIDKHILEKIKPSLVSTGYRGNISFEFFWDGKQVYCHDPTARMPFPCSSIQAHFIKNYAEVLWKVASGLDVRVEVDSKYVAQIGIYTDDIETWRVIRFPEELKAKIGFRRVVIRDGNYYFVPGDPVVATAVGSGETAKAAVDDATNTASQIECSNTSFPAKFIDDILGIIKKLNSLKGDLKF